jgi:cAMP phosphodiesterase
VKIRLLPSTFGKNGTASAAQHLTCFVIDGNLAVDAGSLAMAASDLERNNIRDILLSHAHLDHVAGLPLFIDDLFSSLERPVRVHAAPEVIEILERDIFNWDIYPRFSELENEHGRILEYFPFDGEGEIEIAGYSVTPVKMNHKVPSYGFVISDGKSTIALTGDTAETEDFWRAVDRADDISAILIECAFPDEKGGLAEISHHLTPSLLAEELSKLNGTDCPIFAVNIKPMYADATRRQLGELGIERLKIFEVGREYEF